MKKAQARFIGLITVILIVIAFVLFSRRPSNGGLINRPGTITTSTTVNQASTTPRQLPLQAEYHVNLPNGIMLVDSQGRRTGKDPATGVKYHEIPGTAYGEDCLSKTNCAGELLTTDLPDGQYTFYILGGTTGGFGFSVVNNRDLSQRFSGDIQPGTVMVYSQNYDSANFASSSLAFQDTVSSTASITSEPPHNLPPPPAP